MVKPFKFASTPEIHFGAGRISILPNEIIKRGYNALIITGIKSFINSTTWSELKEELLKEKITFYNEVIAIEPSPDLIDSIVANYANKDIDVVVAIGGGSVLDGGKAISAMLQLNEPVKDYLEGVGKGIEHPGFKVPFIAVPTTSGTGSETTKNAVISQVGKNGFKKSLRHDNFVPDVAIVDPVLTMNCNPLLTATTGMDAFTQLLESYVSTEASPLTDAIAYEGLIGICCSLEKAYYSDCSYVEQLDARRKLAFASMSSGITLANAGLGVVHGFASTIGGFFDIPHGIVCGTLMHEANKITINKLREQNKEHPALIKFAKIGRIYSDEENADINYYCDVLINKLNELTENLEIPRLGEFGITEKDVKRIVENSGNKNNPVKLDKSELSTIIKNRL